MSVYDIGGNQLINVCDNSGVELNNAYDVNGSIIHTKSGYECQPNTFSVLGDSYSTYAGYTDTQEGYEGTAWYPRGTVTNVDQTWWKLFEADTGIDLLINDSWSGTCICYDGYGDGSSDQGDRGISFLNRMNKIGYPQYILIFGGTNDSWVPVQLGTYKYEDWTETDKCYFRPALACLISNMLANHPLSTVVFIKNTELSSGISGSIDTICSYYGITEIKLTGVSKGGGHPTADGMRQIATQIINALGL